MASSLVAAAEERGLTVLEKGRLAARAVISLLGDPQIDPEHVVLPTELVVRDSTAPPAP